MYIYHIYKGQFSINILEHASTYIPFSLMPLTFWTCVLAFCASDLKPAGTEKYAIRIAGQMKETFWVI